MSDPQPGLLPVGDYVERILATVSPLPAFPQPLMEALGLALAEDVVAPISLPSFDNSSMDGYAVVAEDVAGATADSPVTLPVVGEIGAGQSSILALSPGTAVKIMTGAPVPAGATAVVPYESTDRGQTWKLADGTGATAFPDVPANSIQVLKNGGLVVGTDLAVLYRAPGGTAWSRLGTNFPATVAMDVEVGPNGTDLYAATHGRGLWRIALP